MKQAMTRREITLVVNVQKKNDSYAAFFIVVIVLSLYKLLYHMLSYLTCYKMGETKAILSFLSSGHQIVSLTSNSKRKLEKRLIAYRVDLHSHADTIVAVANCVLMHYTGRECDVSPYDTNYSPAKNIPIVSAATAW